MVFQKWRIIRKDGKTYRLCCGTSPLPRAWCQQDVQCCLPKLQGHNSSEFVCTALPASKPVSKSCCSLWRENCSQFSACHSTDSQTPTSVALSRQQSKPHTILCHFTPPSQPQPGLFSTPVSQKKDREHKFNLGNVFADKFCFVSLLDFVHCHLNWLKRNQTQPFLATGC